MMIISPLTLFVTVKGLYRKNANTLTLKIKCIVLVFTILLFLDNIYGVSHTLCVNTQMDNIERAEKLVSYDDQKALSEQKKHLINEIIERKDILIKTKEMLKVGRDSSGASFWNTITAGFLPIVLMFICIYYLLNAIVIKRKKQIEHIINILIILIIVIGLFYLMVDLSEMLSIISDRIGVRNMVAKIALNIALYLVLCVLITLFSKVTATRPSTEDHVLHQEE